MNQFNKINLKFRIIGLHLFRLTLDKGKRKINQCIEKAPDLCYPFFISLRL